MATSSLLAQAQEKDEQSGGHLQPQDDVNPFRAGLLHAGRFAEGSVVAVVFVHTGEGAVFLYLVVMATVLADLIGGSAASVEIGRVPRLCQHHHHHHHHHKQRNNY